MATFTPSTLATLATKAAVDDLRALLSSLQFWNQNPPTIYLYCDTAIARIVPALKYTGKILVKDVLEAYTPYTRVQMERMPGKNFENLWFDFMTEKINLLRWAFDDAKPVNGVLFCDADICFLAPLPAIPAGTSVALSPHMIRVADAKKFGHYNGGFLWFSDKRYADVWWDKCATARYYEQSALEDVAAAVDKATLYEFPITQNYGWWRLWQSDKSPAAMQAEWSIKRGNRENSGIVIAGNPLGSVHTHFSEKRDAATMEYNAWVIGWLNRIAVAHEPTRRFLKHMRWQK